MSIDGTMLQNAANKRFQKVIETFVKSMSEGSIGAIDHQFWGEVSAGNIPFDATFNEIDRQYAIPAAAAIMRALRPAPAYIVETMFRERTNSFSLNVKIFVEGYEEKPDRATRIEIP
jgi:hypothetical protein